MGGQYTGGIFRRNEIDTYLRRSAQEGSRIAGKCGLLSGLHRCDVPTPESLRPFQFATPHAPRSRPISNPNAELARIPGAARQSGRRFVEHVVHHPLQHPRHPRLGSHPAGTPPPKRARPPPGPRFEAAFWPIRSGHQPRQVLGYQPDHGSATDEAIRAIPTHTPIGVTVLEPSDQHTRSRCGPAWTCTCPRRRTLGRAHLSKRKQ